MSLVKSDVLAQFRTEDSYRGSVLTLERDPLAAPYGHVFIRLYHQGPFPRVVSTSGFPANAVASDVVSDHTENLFFQGQDSASFGRPVVQNARVLQVGRFLGNTGLPVDGVNLTVNELTGEIRANQQVYGTAQATYQSRYTRLQCAFQKLQDASGSPSDYAPMVVMAFNTFGERASISLDPPNRNDGGASYGAYDRATGESLLVELDNKFPVALAHNDSRSKLAAIARLFVYGYGDALTVQTSLGATVSGGFETLDMVEGVSFNGSQSQSVRYPPVNGISVASQGQFFSEFTSPFSPMFVAGGSRVSVVQWRGYQRYSLTGDRATAANEVVCTSGGGVPVPATGLARASYSTRRQSLTLRWVRDDAAWFEPVVVLVRDSKGRSGTLVVSPPNRRGV